MNRIMVICDESPFYAQRLADYANQKGRLPFTAISFSTAERLMQYLEEQKADVLLVAADLENLGSLQKLARQVITLHDKHQLDTGLPSVFKYQSSDNLLREVMSLCEAEEEALTGSAGQGNCSITGVYSPVNRCGKTSFSIVYAQSAARENRTLYVNLEDCSGFSRLFPGTEGSGDLTDALYYFKQRMLTPVKMASVIHSLGDLDYIPPVRYPEDLCETDALELGRLLKHLAATGGYHTLVADLGQIGKKAVPVLEVCDEIFMPMTEDLVSAAKIGEFEHYLQVSQRSDICDRLKKLVLPPFKPLSAGGAWMEHLLWGELGDYVRTLMKGGDAPWYQ